MYSQYEEDEYFLEVLKNIKNGKLIEIGAWSPTCFSNSRALIEQGWTALLVEPSPGPVKDLLREYGKIEGVQVLSSAVTIEGGIIELQITDDAVSMPTSDLERIDTWKSDAGFYGKLLVNSISATEFFTRYGAGVEFVSIDTEGTSVNIFSAMLNVGIRPRCICVEHDSRFVELSQYAEQANYQMIHENGTNRVYRWTGQ